MHGRTEMPTPSLPTRGRGGISCCVKLLQHRGRWEMSPHSNMLQTQQVLTSRLTLDCCEHNSSGSANLFSFPWHQILPFSQSRWHLGDIHIYKLFNTLWCHDTSVTAILDLESKPWFERVTKFVSSVEALFLLAVYVLFSLTVEFEILHTKIIINSTPLYKISYTE